MKKIRDTIFSLLQRNVYLAAISAQLAKAVHCHVPQGELSEEWTSWPRLQQERGISCSWPSFRTPWIAETVLMQGMLWWRTGQYPGHNLLFPVISYCAKYPQTGDHIRYQPLRSLPRLLEQTRNRPRPSASGRPRLLQQASKLALRRRLSTTSWMQSTSPRPHHQHQRSVSASQ